MENFSINLALIRRLPYFSENPSIEHKLDCTVVCIMGGIKLEEWVSRERLCWNKGLFLCISFSSTPFCFWFCFICSILISLFSLCFLFFDFGFFWVIFIHNRCAMWLCYWRTNMEWNKFPSCNVVKPSSVARKQEREGKGREKSLD